MTQLRVLAALFACLPPSKDGHSGGEDVLGWNLLVQIAKYHEVWALVHSLEKRSLDQALANNPNLKIHVEYVDLPLWLRPLLKIQGGHQLYYYLWQFKSYFVARRLHRTVKFDLFHHITYANDWMASFIGAFLPVPYIRGPGGGAHRTPSGFHREYSLLGRIWEQARGPGQWFFRADPVFALGQHRAKAILVCNNESIRSLSSGQAQKAHLFPVSGVSTQDLSDTYNKPVASATFDVLSAGSLIKVKGFGLTVKAFADFCETHPDSKLTIVGSGPEEKRLRKLLSQLKLDSKANIVSSMPREQLLARMSQCDVFLFPSLRDGGGTVVVEAMAKGKPVVCLDTGGPTMHVNEECGIAVAPTVPEIAVKELSLALTRLQSDSSLRSRLGENAARRARQFYHWDKLGERLRDIYQKALETKTTVS